ncbi:MAG: HmuY family protein [Myxococcota bacterium]
MRRSLFFSLALLLACDDLGSSPVDSGADPDAGTDDAGEVDAGASEPVQHTDIGNGVTETLVDGTDTRRWLALDLDNGGAVLDVSITEDTAWDLAIQRFAYRTNGGAGGPGNVRVAFRDDVTFEAATQAPEVGWTQDQPAEDSMIPDDVPMGEEVPTTVISHGEDPWFNYNPMTHVLTPKERVYFIETSDRAYVALQPVDYYSPETGDSGYPAFRWKMVDAPDGVLPGFDVDASSRDTWVYLNLSGEVVTVENEATDPWDLAIQRTAIRTNGGVSGPGVGGAREATETWEVLTETTTVGFVEDSLLPLPGPPGSGEAPGNSALATWFDYEESTRTVSARANAAFVVRGAAGGYSKLRVLAWDDGVYRLEIEPIARVVDTRSASIDASSTDVWAYFSFRQGELVEVSSASDDPSWDIGFQRTAITTNGGTSGEGEGASYEASAAFDEIDAVDGEFLVDEDLPLPGPPGSGTFSGNPALNTWFDYNESTREVSVRDTAFVVRTADGGFVKLQVEAWDDGNYTLRWAYAGAGGARFGDDE